MASTSPCPACGGLLVAWCEVPSSEPILGGAQFVLWRCTACGTAVTVGGGLPAELDDRHGVDDRHEADDLYASGAYRRHTPRLARLATPVVRLFTRERLALLSRLAAPGARVLDAGAGQGRFVARASDAGYRATGFDPFPRGPGVARAGFDDAPVPDGGVDVVTLWHVLEHLEDPAAALDAVRGWLVPGGGAIVAVPNLASWQARVGGPRWFHLDVPRHRVHFTPAGLERLLGDHGFEAIGIEHRLLEHNPFGLWQSALNRIGHRPSWLFSLLKGNARWEWGQALLVLAALPLVPVAIAAERWAGSRGHGGTIVVLARRVDAPERP